MRRNAGGCGWQQRLNWRFVRLGQRLSWQQCCRGRGTIELRAPRRNDQNVSGQECTYDSAERHDQSFDTTNIITSSSYMRPSRIADQDKQRQKQTGHQIAAGQAIRRTGADIRDPCVSVVRRPLGPAPAVRSQAGPAPPLLALFAQRSHDIRERAPPRRGLQVSFALGRLSSPTRLHPSSHPCIRTHSRPRSRRHIPDHSRTHDDGDKRLVAADSCHRRRHSSAPNER